MLVLKASFVAICLESCFVSSASGTVSLADVCLRVSEVVSDEKVDDGLLPEYNCLSLSPVRFWKQDKHR